MVASRRAVRDADTRLTWGVCERRVCEMGRMTTYLVVGENVEASDDFDVVRGSRVVQQDELGRDRVLGSLDGRESICRQGWLVNTKRTCKWGVYQ